jgi:hypothetical protein
MKSQNILQIIIFLLLIGVIIFLSIKCLKNKCDDKKDTAVNSLTQTLNSNKITIRNLQQKIKEKEQENLHNTYKLVYYSQEAARTSAITDGLLERFAPSLRIKNKKPLLGAAAGDNQNQIDNTKGDNGAAAASKAASSQGEKEITPILLALYKAFNGNFDSASTVNLVKQIGVGLLNVLLAAGGLGFLSGTINGLFAGIPPGPASPPSGSQLVANLENWLKNQAVLSTLNTQMNTITNVFNLVANNLSDYSTQKNNKGNLCPPSGPCTPNTSGNGCDFVQDNTNLINCMKQPTQYQNILYDPNISLPSGNSGTSTRGYLSAFLQNGGQNFTSYIGQTVQQMNGLLNLDQIYTNLIQGMDLTNSSTNPNPNYTTNITTLAYTTVQLYQFYLYIIIYTITYYQELASVDDNTPDSTYNNPWNSSYIGNPKNIKLANGAQGSGSLLGDLQRICSYPGGDQKILGLYKTIYNAFNRYFITLVFTVNQSPCCNDPCGQEGVFSNPCNCSNNNHGICDPTTCSGCTISQTMADNSTVLVNAKSRNPSDPTISWYVLMNQKHNDPNYAQTVNVGGPDTYESYCTKFLTYYCEYLNFPLDVYINYCKMAGVVLTSTGTVSNPTSPTPTTSADLFNNILYSLYTQNADGKTNPVFSTPTGLLPIRINQSFDNINGGYPFGTDNHSYADAYNLQTNPLPYPTTLSDYQTMNDYNTMCTSLVKITPGAPIDNIEIFNNGADPTKYTNNSMVCSDFNADSIKSCLIPGSYPGSPGATKGITDSLNPNSRSVYCYDSNSGVVSILKKNPNLPYQLPSQPAPGFNFRIWEITLYDGSIYRLQAIGGHLSMNDMPFINGTPIADGPTITFTVQDGTTGALVFDNNEYIIGGNIHAPPTTVYTTPPTKNYHTEFPIPVKYYDCNMPVAPTVGVKIWVINSSNSLTLDTSGNYSLNGTQLPPLTPSIAWNLTVVWPGFSVVFGKNESTTQTIQESISSCNLGGSIFVNIPSSSYELPTIPPSGQIKNWILNTSSNYINMNPSFQLDSSGVFNVNGVNVNISANFNNYSYSYTDSNNNLYSAILTFGPAQSIISGSISSGNPPNVNTSKLINTPIIPSILSSQPIPPVAPYTLKKWAISGNPKLQDGITVYELDLDISGNYSLVLGNVSNGVVTLNPPGIPCVMTWNGGSVNFTANVSQIQISGQFNFDNKQNIISGSITSTYSNGFPINLKVFAILPIPYSQS